MAEEVEIVNVVGNLGPASEATLQKLLDALNKNGGTSRDARKIQEAANREIVSSTKKVDEFGVEIEEATDSVDNFGNAISGVLGAVWGLGKALVGFTLGTFANMVDAFKGGTGTLTDFANQIPIIGSLLGKITGYLDETLTVFQSLSKVGASFGNDLNSIRDAAARSRLPLDEFAGLIISNSQNLQMLAGSVTEGAKRLGLLNNVMGEELREKMLSMGYTFEEINENLINYAVLNRSRERLNSQNAQTVAKNAAEYASTLMTLSKLTGDDINSIRDRQKEQQNDVMFQRKLANMSEEEAARVKTAMAQAELQGPGAVARLKEMVMGFPPLTRETQIFTATVQGGEEALRSYLALVKSGGTTEEFKTKLNKKSAEAIADMIEGINKAESALTFGALSGQGIGSEMIEMLQAAGIDLAKYSNMSRKEIQKQVALDIEQAEKESDVRNSSVEALTKFQNMLRRINQALVINIISPLMNLLGPQLELLVDSISESVGSLIESGYFEKFKETIINLTKDIKEFGLIGAIKNLFDIDLDKSLFAGLADTLSNSIKNLFDIDLDKNLFAGLTDIIKNGFNLIHWGEIGTLIGEKFSQLFTGSPTTPNTGPMHPASHPSTAPSAGGGGLIAALMSNLPTLEQALSAGGWIIGGLAALAGVVTLFGVGPVAIGMGVLTAFFIGNGFAMGLLADGIKTIADAVDTFAEGVIKFERLDSKKILSVATSLGPLEENLYELAKSGIISKLLGDKFFEKLAVGLDAIASVNSSNIDQISSGLQNLSKFSDLELNADSIIDYKDAIEDLTEAIAKLNSELNEQNSGGPRGRPQANAGQLLSGTTLGGGSSNSSSESLDQLNNMMAKLVILTEQNTRQNREIITSLGRIRGVVH